MNRVILLVILLICIQFRSYCQLPRQFVENIYYCTPCGNPACDTIAYDHPGICPICHMALIRQTGRKDPSMVNHAYNGYWEGVARTTDQEIHFSLDIASNIYFNSLDLKALHVTAGDVQYNGDSLQFDLKGDDDIIEFKILLKNEKLTGNLFSHLQSTSIQNRTASFELRLVQLHPINYTVHEVSFRNDSVILAGSLYLPNGVGKFPALVCNHSSGDKPRYDGAFMADYMATKGIAVLIYDKRGNGQSTGDWKTSSFEDLADDCIAGIKFLKTVSEINPGAIGIFGHSQGATISPIIVGRAPDIAFNVAASGFAVSPEEQDIYRVTNILKRNAHFNNEVIDSAIHFYTIWLEVARTGKGWDELEMAKSLFQNTQWYGWVEPPPKGSWPWKWYLNAGNYNFVPFWEKVKIPTLLIYGENDEITPVKPSVSNIIAALKKAQNHQYKLIILPECSHYFTLPKKEGDQWEKSSQDYLESIYQWIRATFLK